MKCNECNEKLSDFLLDELPESEAVLVQEHLALCPECMATYKQLKGTGKAMEAVPAMRSVQSTTGFNEQVISAARIESQKIIETLPPEKRLRVEARAAARRANIQIKAPSAVTSVRKQSPWSGAVIGILLLGMAAVAAILLYPAGGLERAAKDLGVLTISAGKAEQFFQKQGEQWSAVTPGKPVRSDDEFATRDDGRIRIDLEDGGLFMGPASELKFRRTKEGEDVLLAHLTNGELLAERAGKDADQGAWTIRTDAAVVTVPANARVFIRASRSAQGRQCDVHAISGAARVEYWSGKGSAEIKTGEQASFWEDARIEPQKSTPESLIPLWRTDLVNDRELARCFSGAARVADRRAEGLVVELAYGFGKAGGLEDWTLPGGQAMGQKPDGSLQLPADARCTLCAPIGAPASIEAVILPESARDGGLACVLLDGEKGRVSVDFDKQEAVLQVREADHPGAARVPFRSQAKAVERTRLEIAAAGLELHAVAVTAAGKSKSVHVPKSLEAPGAAWVSALREDAQLEGIRVIGLVPRKWLRQKLASLSPLTF